MAESPAAAVWSRLSAWPQGYFTARYEGRRYGVSNALHAGGRSLKLYAEELGVSRATVRIQASAS